MKLKYCYLLWLLTALWICVPQQASAQMKRITGKVLRTEPGKKKPVPFEDPGEIQVLGYHSVAAAKRELEQFEKQAPGTSIMPTPDVTAELDYDGYYTMDIASSGAILVWTVLGEHQLQEIRGQMQVNFTLEGSIMLEETRITAKRINPGIDSEPPIDDGNTITYSANLTIPEHKGQKNARCIFQPILIDCNTAEVVKYGQPKVYDGTEYALTQARRMEFDMRHDTLHPFIERKKLTDGELKFHYSATFSKPNKNHSYTCLSSIRVTDYIQNYMEDDQQLGSCYARRPFKFLTYDTRAFFELNPKDFYEKPRAELRDGEDYVNLNFAVGKSTLDENDSINRVQLANLRKTFRDITGNLDYSLRKVEIRGFASPEGNYASNRALAAQRAETAKSLIKGMVGSTFLNVKGAEVLGWDVVADSLEMKGHPTEAAQIRLIVENNKGNMDRQYQQIRGLEFYSSLIESVLPNLRFFKISYQYQTNRVLEPAEILNAYRNDPDFKPGGSRRFSRYEWWCLFDQLKGTPGVEDNVYKRAYRETKSTDSIAWAFAANKVALTEMRKGNWDLEILRPYIDVTVQNLNQTRRIEGKLFHINTEEILANQAITYYQNEVNDTAYYLARKLPAEVEAYRPIRYITAVRALLFKRNKTTEENALLNEARSWLMDTSIQNRVVLQVAMMQNDAALTTLEQLPENSALRWYFSAVVHARNMNEDAARTCLTQCANLDKEMIPWILMDGDLTDDVRNDWADEYFASQPTTE